MPMASVNPVALQTRRRSKMGWDFRGWRAYDENPPQVGEYDDESRRFYIKSKDTSEHVVLFLDDDPPFVHEHEVWDVEKFPIRMRCGRKTQRGCPLCEAGDEPYFAGLFTILDRTEWTDRNGKAHKDEKKLLIVKTKDLIHFRKMADKRAGLLGTEWDVSRTSKQDSRIGNIWEFRRKVDLSTAGTKGIDIVAFDYDEVMPEKSYEDLAAVAKKIKKGDSEQKGGGFRGRGADQPGQQASESTVEKSVPF